MSGEASPGYLPYPGVIGAVDHRSITLHQGVEAADVIKVMVCNQYVRQRKAPRFEAVDNRLGVTGIHDTGGILMAEQPDVVVRKSGNRVDFQHGAPFKITGNPVP